VQAQQWRVMLDITTPQRYIVMCKNSHMKDTILGGQVCLCERLDV
jgi:hypothetical protein